MRLSYLTLLIAVIVWTCNKVFLYFSVLKKADKSMEIMKMVRLLHYLRFQVSI